MINCILWYILLIRSIHSLGFSNFVAMSSGFACPYVIGVVLESGGDTFFLWSMVFYSAAAISVFGALVFLTLGTAERQEWDKSPEDVDKLIATTSQEEEEDRTIEAWPLP